MRWPPTFVVRVWSVFIVSGSMAHLQGMFGGFSVACGGQHQRGDFQDVDDIIALLKNRRSSTTPPFLVDHPRKKKKIHGGWKINYYIT